MYMYPVCTEYCQLYREISTVMSMRYCCMYNVHWGSLLAFHSYAFDSVLQYKVTGVCEHVPINFKLILVPYHNVLNEPLHGPGSPGRTIR